MKTVQKHVVHTKLHLFGLSIPDEVQKHVVHINLHLFCRMSIPDEDQSRNTLNYIFFAYEHT